MSKVVERYGVRSIALFRWRPGLRDEVMAAVDDRVSPDESEQLTYEASQPAAVALLSALRASGHSRDLKPYPGEGGWHIGANVGEREFALFINWTGIGGAQDNLVAIQPSLSRGCLASLFFPRPPAATFEPLCTVLETALNALPDVCGPAPIEWTG